MPVRLLLDTNVVLGLLKNTGDIGRLEELQAVSSDECAYSSITRIELLGFHGISENEDGIIRNVLNRFHYLAVTRQIEDIAIEIRRRSKTVKLPDALIMATARAHCIRLVTLVEDLKRLNAHIS